jgi:DNA polymerase IV
MGSAAPPAAALTILRARVVPTRWAPGRRGSSSSRRLAARRAPPAVIGWWLRMHGPSPWPFALAEVQSPTSGGLPPHHGAPRRTRTYVRLYLPPVEVQPSRQGTILHADLDAFYASVEQLLDPSLRNRPIAVGGSVVLAASYEARSYGVRGGMPAWRARQLCGDLLFVGGQFGRYQQFGDDVVSVFYDFTPRVERVSIDEAFLDVAGAVHLFGAPTAIAAAIRRRVRDEIGLPLSVGVARTKHLAKVASQVAKPNGLVAVPPGDERDFLDPLPIRLIWGVGPTTERRLHQAGISTIGQLAAAGSPILGNLLGQAAGAKLAALSANIDERAVATPARARSMGAQAALGRRAATPEFIRETLGYLADRVASRLRKAALAGRTVTVRVRFSHMRSVTRSVTLPFATSTTLTLTEVAEELAHCAILDNEPEREVTLIAVAASNLCPDHGLQLELPLDSPNWRRNAGPRPRSVVEASRRGVDHSVDAIRDKFGRTAVGYATVTFSTTERVPEEFRELAERGPGSRDA